MLFENGYLAAQLAQGVGGAGSPPSRRRRRRGVHFKLGVPTGGPNDGFGITMLGNTMLKWGTEEQKRHYLPRILSGEDRWCQGYSEPAAGSDLGNLGCRAVLDGDEWVINIAEDLDLGRSSGRPHLRARPHRADGDEAPRHHVLARGHAPAGCRVRPIKMMSGDSEFNEVFFSDARCPKENVLGEVNGGWAVAMALLGNERGAGAAVQALSFRGELDKVVALAKERLSPTTPTSVSG
ncbi:MAG: acyl-CoA dehydrogenase family protein [Ilumatobacteraceae bacterium]